MAMSGPTPGYRHGFSRRTCVEDFFPHGRRAIAAKPRQPLHALRPPACSPHARARRQLDSTPPLRPALHVHAALTLLRQMQDKAPSMQSRRYSESGEKVGTSGFSWNGSQARTGASLPPLGSPSASSTGIYRLQCVRSCGNAGKPRKLGRPELAPPPQLLPPRPVVPVSPLSRQKGMVGQQAVKVSPGPARSHAPLPPLPHRHRLHVTAGRPSGRKGTSLTAHPPLLRQPSTHSTQDSDLQQAARARVRRHASTPRLTRRARGAPRRASGPRGPRWASAPTGAAPQDPEPAAT